MSKTCTLLYRDTTTGKFYEKVEYIQSLGQQYIDINYNMDFSKDWRLSGQICVDAKDNANSPTLFGATKTGYGRAYGFTLSSSNNHIRICNGSSTPVTIISDKSPDLIGKWYDFSMEVSTSLERMSLSFTGDTSFSGTLTGGGTAFSISPYIFTINGGNNSWMKCKISKLVITGNDAGAIRNYIAVRDIDTGEYGLYDTINKKFYGNAGSGAFAGGPVVYKLNLSNQYKDTTTGSLYEEVEYISTTSARSQFINTGLTFNRSQPKVEMKISNLTVKGNLFGTYNGTNAWTNGWGLFDNYGNTAYMYIHYNSNAQFSVSDMQNGTFVMDRNKVYYNGTLVHTQGSIDSYVCNNPMYIPSGNFGGSSKAEVPVCNIHYVKVWIDDVMQRDYVPVRNLTTNEYGLFDKLNNKFYGNAGSGNFTGGDVKKSNVIRSGAKTAIKITLN